ncbi:MAG: archaemetzincin family Zn-dependent metalloprotease [Promethearchaeota archaeon]|jgi:archaemetzincin
MKSSICLQKIGTLKPDVLIKLKKNIEQTFSHFNIGIKINPSAFHLHATEYNAKRSQYNASKILKKLIKTSQNTRSFRTLGVVDEDIYKNKLNFVFGLAHKTMGVAVISITRLRDDFYIEKGSVHRQIKSEGILDLRILKEAIHELGHTFGLPHCTNYCIMQFSNSLIDTDNKPKEFCESCARNLENFFNKSDQSS